MGLLEEEDGITQILDFREWFKNILGNLGVPCCPPRSWRKYRSPIFSHFHTTYIFSYIFSFPQKLEKEVK